MDVFLRECDRFGKIHELESLEQRERGLNKIMFQYSGKDWVFDKDTLKNIRVWKMKSHR